MPIANSKAIHSKAYFLLIFVNGNNKSNSSFSYCQHYYLNSMKIYIFIKKCDVIKIFFNNITSILRKSECFLSYYINSSGISKFAYTSCTSSCSSNASINFIIFVASSPVNVTVVSGIIVTSATDVFILFVSIIS
jgi:hypothetical protein